MIKLPEKLIVHGNKKFLLRVEDSDQAVDYQKYEIYARISGTSQMTISPVAGIYCVKIFYTKAAVYLSVLLNRMMMASLF